MIKKHLHIVCHDVPYPLDYGGVFDLFCKLKALKDAGVSIYLHCFEYGRGRQPELNRYCEEVYYYHRNEGHKGFSVKFPYIVCSRCNNELMENLLKDNYPILLEGIHCTYLTNNEKFLHRKIIIRLHNIEYAYYYQLYRHSGSFFKKLYYYNESRLLKKYEKRLARRFPIIAVAKKDALIYRQKFHANNITQIPVFVPWNEIKCLEGMGTYCVYHGNLSVEENEKAAIWLIEKVFNDLKVPFVIAGKNPSSRLQKLTDQKENICLLANPAEDEMRDLISKAQINVLPSFNETGIKLKLINALFNGRHCVVNEAAVEDTGLESACHTGTTADAIKQIVIQLYHQPFAPEEKMLRQKILCSTYNNKLNAEKIIALIW
ncbi:MAG TPA: glycosyltransferase [Chitinophagaceae bacterium]|nr:glycosyltransferase [Chitinophagaceae bacterium]